MITIKQRLINAALLGVLFACVGQAPQGIERIDSIVSNISTTVDNPQPNMAILMTIMMR